MSKPILGYPSRTAAVIALRQSGMTTREIAAKLGLSTSAVSSLEISHGRLSRGGNGSPAVGAHPRAKIEDYFSMEHKKLLRPHAEKREVSLSLLIKDIVRMVAESDLVDAVLDDGGRP